MAQQYEVVAGAGVPGVWSGPLHAVQGTSLMLYECAACGAIVRDQARHDGWHDAHDH